MTSRKRHIAQKEPPHQFPLATGCRSQSSKETKHMAIQYKSLSTLSDKAKNRLMGEF